MGKIVRNGITYGIDEDEIKMSVEDCESATGSEIAGAKALAELKELLESNFQAGVDRIISILRVQGNTSVEDNSLDSVLEGIGKAIEKATNDGIAATKQGNANTFEVLKDRTFVNNNGFQRGTMTDHSGQEEIEELVFTPSAELQRKLIPEGFYNGKSSYAQCEPIMCEGTFGIAEGNLPTKKEDIINVDMGEHNIFRYVNMSAAYNLGYGIGFQNALKESGTYIYTKTDGSMGFTNFINSYDITDFNPLQEDYSDFTVPQQREITKQVKLTNPTYKSGPKESSCDNYILGRKCQGTIQTTTYLYTGTHPFTGEKITGTGTSTYEVGHDADCSRDNGAHSRPDYIWSKKYTGIETYYTVKK